MEDRFRLLKIFSKVFKVVAWAALVIGLVGVVGILISGGTPETPRAMALQVLLSAALSFVIFYTIAEVIRLLLVIAEQTRKESTESGHG